MTFSTILNINSRLLTGLQFDFTSPADGFLIKGFTSASFHSAQNSLVSRDRLVMYIIAGMHWSSTCLGLSGGITSSWHDWAGIVAISIHSSCSVTGANLVSCAISS